MTKKELKIKAKAAWEKTKMAVGPVIVGVPTGTVLGGSFLAYENNKRIKKLETDLKDHCKWADGAVDVYNNFVDRTHDRFDELQRQNNLLMERALKETEGSAE